MCLLYAVEKLAEFDILIACHVGVWGISVVKLMQHGIEYLCPILAMQVDLRQKILLRHILR